MLRQSARTTVKNVVNSSYLKSTPFMLREVNMRKNFYSTPSINIDNKRPEPDEVLRNIASYVHNQGITSGEAYDTAQ